LKLADVECHCFSTDGSRTAVAMNVSFSSVRSNQEHRAKYINLQS